MGDVVKARNWTAVAAWLRNGGPMKHKNTPRGGQTNESRDYLAQAEIDDVHPAEIVLSCSSSCDEGCCVVCGLCPDCANAVSMEEAEPNLEFFEKGGVPPRIEASEETFDAFRDKNVTKPDGEDTH